MSPGSIYLGNRSSDTWGKCTSFTVVMHPFIFVSSIYPAHKSADILGKMTIIYHGYDLLVSTDVSSIYLGHRSADMFGKIF